ncbi:MULTISPECIES: antiviral reverse transcriptase Drt3a [unclassified Variovorax]|uniref:antiviral reverse transcriptase Drt3a n=1 Tax=unclassified Variovorax TaxID=663243 RepID=UPI0025749960|nr:MULTISPECIES: antiviral reverse transcriptase Drt3a [unclassified Variovorax]MDM0086483.1 antiviral reverse transcriptase Drt3a [Variovorax sp. J22G40]MDM0145260.1 antiviral reverse transcriptase Drt3a [Variovorax sp. J2P1-31]
MYDLSFSKRSLETSFEKRDLSGISSANHASFKSTILAAAEISAQTKFETATPLLGQFPLKGKTIFHFLALEHEIVARKLCENIKKTNRIPTKGRSEIVSSLRLLLKEGVPFRVYRLDISSFYESFMKADIMGMVDSLHRLSPHSKILMRELLEAHTSLGGSGVPRGLSVSAALSNLMMRDFDHSMKNSAEVFFYARYVDDIIMLTSCREDPVAHIRQTEKNLPRGLRLNPSKKEIIEVRSPVSPRGSADAKVCLFKFSYLGYEFIAYEPVKSRSKKDGSLFRDVTTDIASKKIQRIKTRISRSFHEFSRTNNFILLRDRIKFLTMNFGIYNAKAGGKKLAGIYHSYPLVSNDAPGLKHLDDFLRNAILSKTGRLNSSSAPMLSAQRRQELMACSFVKGHSEKRFVYFSGIRLKEIQKCWAH